MPSGATGLKYFTDSWLSFSFKNQDNEVVHESHNLLYIFVRGTFAGLVHSGMSSLNSESREDAGTRLMKTHKFQWLSLADSGCGCRAAEHRQTGLFLR